MIKKDTKNILILNNNEVDVILELIIDKISELQDIREEQEIYYMQKDQRFNYGFVEHIKEKEIYLKRLFLKLGGTSSLIK